MKARLHHFSLLAFVLLFAFGSGLRAQIQITFGASGASNTYDNVIVENITKGTSVTVPAGYALNLINVVSSVDNQSYKSDPLIISSTSSGEVIASFNAPKAEDVSVAIWNLQGKKIAETTLKVKAGVQSVILKSPKGVNIVGVQGSTFRYSKKFINTAGFAKTSIEVNNSSETSPMMKTPATQVIMNYNTGDELIYKGISGVYKTYISDQPKNNKAITFDFIECKDYEGYNYAVVLIGNQYWMAENLRTTYYNNGIQLPNIDDENTWLNYKYGAYCNYNNDAQIGNTFGKIYNWRAFSSVYLSVVPTGWKIPNDADYQILMNTLGDVSKRYASRTDWIPCLQYPYNPGPGYEPELNNGGGLNAQPGGCRMNGFWGLGAYAMYWSSEVIMNYPYNTYWDFEISGCNNVIHRQACQTYDGLYIRCVKQ